ncbi:MAG: NADH-quinone oxidoreductase subunit N [Limisphaerales bacterium]
MNTSLITLEIAVVVLGLIILLADLWMPTEHKRKLGYVAAGGLSIIFAASFFTPMSWSSESFSTVHEHTTVIKIIKSFGDMLVVDSLAIFFKQFFILAAIFVLLMAIEFADRIQTGISEFYALILFALSGMMFAASANDFVLVFVALELVSISFYILNSFQRNRLASLEAGIKYLMLSALSAAFLVFGIALIFGTATTTNFSEIQTLLQSTPALAIKPIFLLGLLFVVVGLGFKIAAFPFQVWAPDVYQGSPAPATAFLAVGSKAAGIVLLLRVLFSAVPEVAQHWNKLLMILAAITILYGNLCAIPQRNLKRLFGYSSIANAGYLLLGFVPLSQAGTSAILYYLAGYLFSVIATFTVICIITRQNESEDVTILAGLSQRSPLLAAAMTLAMVSLAGIPPLAGFFGKFLLLKAIVEQAPVNPAYYFVAAIAIIGVVISLYYYFGIIRAIYWSKETTDLSPILISTPTKISLLVCVAGMFFLGLFPNRLLEKTTEVAKVLHPKSSLIEIQKEARHP